MRITDLAVPAPVVGTRPPASRRAGDSGASTLVSATRQPGHPDEVAASALARAAGLAHATKVVATANEHAASSVRGDSLDLTRIP